MALIRELRKSNFTGQGVDHQPGQPIVEARQLRVSYGQHMALDNVTFRLLTSQRVAVIGPNGAGKSTLFKVIAGVIKPTSGEVNVYGHGPNGHICIAYVPQRSQVDWNFPVTVADVVMMGRTGKIGMLRWPGARDREIVEKSLADVGLLDLAGRQISELSGGQQQRMFIARALAQEAELILMDEPLNGLDVTSQEIIFEILDELRKRNVTVMVATHDLDHAAEMFDQVMLLKHRLIGFGLPQEVLTAGNLIDAYGGHLRLIEAEGVTLAVGDTCCDEDRLP
ncbi:MAG: metal ABC transporter ATP-binding protein [Chloroflexi bacterium]|jgi:manganese/iron transport system ATP-binding protein|nr:metal ABC transporter ATP-binding protein [Chloroflexota bacterium]